MGAGTKDGPAPAPGADGRQAEHHHRNAQETKVVPGRAPKDATRHRGPARGPGEAAWLGTLRLDRVLVVIT